MQRAMLSIQATPDTSQIRTAEFRGNVNTVIPTVALVEGVLWPANAPAPELALAEEFGRFPDGWNGRPVTFDHPKLNGIPVSAGDPEVLEINSFGQLFNTTLEDGKLKTEIWIDESLVARMSEEIQDTVRRLKEGDEVVEVSTGLFTMTEMVEGTFQGEEFSGVWRNIVPDHLAVLPDGVKGACSVEDGCGAPRLNSEVPATSDRIYINGQHEGFVPVMRGAQLRVEKDEPCCDNCAKGEPCVNTDDLTEEKRGALQRLMDAAKEFVSKSDGNQDEETVSTNQESNMDKDQLVQDLIANEGTQYSEDDRDWLSSLEESQLAKMSPVVNEDSNETLADIVADAEVVEIDTPEDAEGDAPAINAEAEDAAPVSTEDYIAGAPAEVQAVLNSGLKMHRERKAKLIEGLCANSRNTFTKEQLEAKDIDELEGLAALAGQEVSYEGAGGGLSKGMRDNADVNYVPVTPVFDLSKKPDAA